MIDLEQVRNAETAFGLGDSDGHEVLMLIGPMADEIRTLRATLRRVHRIASSNYYGASDRRRALLMIAEAAELEGGKP